MLENEENYKFVAKVNKYHLNRKMSDYLYECEKTIDFEIVDLNSILSICSFIILTNKTIQFLDYYKDL